MHLPRILLVILATHAIARAGEAPPDAAAIDALAARIVQLGYPDCAGATLYSGRAAIEATVRGADEPPLPTGSSTSQRTRDDDAVTYAFAIDGLHARLADGSWLIRLRDHLRADADLTIAVAGEPLDPATLTASAQAAHPFKPEEVGGFLRGVPAVQREAAATTMAATVPVSFLLRLNPDDMPLATIALQRAGWDGAASLARSVALVRARDYWQQRYWTVAAPPFDPTGTYAGMDRLVTDWRAANPTPPVEAAAVALRRALHREFRSWAMQASPGRALTAAQAAAAAIATLDDGDPQGLRPRIEAIAEAQRIPAQVAADAPLADRLRAWAEPAGPGEMRVRSGAGGASISTAFVTPPAAYVPRTEDAAALVALVGDDRPCRWLDFSGARTVGDNALRALAELTKRDPRADAGTADLQPWTAERRHRTAAALAAAPTAAEPAP